MILIAMRHILLVLLSFVCYTSLAQSWSLNETVYISTGCNAYAFHQKRNCYSLRECNASGHVSTTSRYKAVNDKRRTPCGRCLKKEYKLWKEKKWLVRRSNKTIRNAQAAPIIKWYEKR